MMQPGTQAITAIHIALIVILAVLVVIGVIYGGRLKRRRASREQAVEARAHEAGVGRVATTPDDQPGKVPAPTPVAPSPVAPPPPPLSDAPAPGISADAVAPPLANEPIAAAAPSDAGPAAEALASVVPLSPAADDWADRPVTLLKGLGPKVSARLAEIGITRVGQIAALDDDGARALDAQLGPFAGRMARDQWVRQARLLAAGDKAGFEATFGKL